MDSNYTRRLETQRQKREEYFAEHPQSPVPSEQFAGLEYYPVDRAYRFELELRGHEDIETLTVETTAGGSQEYLRWGEFRFELGGETRSIQAYRADADDDRLWVPFRDDTNDEETYGAGRYLDLEPDSHQLADGRWVLDFNEGYDKEHEQRHTADVEPLDKRRVVSGVDLRHGDVELTRQVPQNGFHAAADATAVGVELREHAVGVRTERVERRLARQLDRTATLIWLWTVGHCVFP